MSKVKASELIVQLKAKVTALEKRLADNGVAVEHIATLQSFAERIQQLREYLADADSNFTQAQVQIAELEADLRQADYERVQADASHFAEVKAIKAKHKTDTHRLIIIDTLIIIATAILFGW